MPRYQGDSNPGQKAWVEPWLLLGQVHVCKYMFTINMLKFIIKKKKLILIILF